MKKGTRDTRTGPGSNLGLLWGPGHRPSGPLPEEPPGSGPPTRLLPWGLENEESEGLARRGRPGPPPPGHGHHQVTGKQVQTEGSRGASKAPGRAGPQLGTDPPRRKTLGASGKETQTFSNWSQQAQTWILRSSGFEFFPSTCEVLPELPRSTHV